MFRANQGTALTSSKSNDLKPQWLKDSWQQITCSQWPCCSHREADVGIPAARREPTSSRVQALLCVSCPSVEWRVEQLVSGCTPPLLTACMAPALGGVPHAGMRVMAMGLAALPDSTDGTAQPPLASPWKAGVQSPHGCDFCRRDPDAFGSRDETSEAGSQGTEQADADRLSSHGAATSSSQGTRPPYIISQPVPSDAELSGLLLEKLQAAASRETSILQGLNVSADSFYSSQVQCTAPVHVLVNRAACA